MAKFDIGMCGWVKSLAAPALVAFAGLGAFAGELVIVQTNDTHSQIDPTDGNLGGVLRRKVVVDSIRAKYPDMLLVDTGDAVQGTLYFNVYKGEVEMRMMNELGYDYAVLGNHDFDNGTTSLANNLGKSKVEWITTNYDLAGSGLEPFFKPYAIREVAGKRIGLIGINLVPKGMISEGNYDGVVYLDGIKAANSTAWHLKHNEKVDYVVALTHVGYEDVPYISDKEIVAASEDIDLLMGGHSHTLIKPGSGNEWVTNAVGKPVLVTQNGKSGTVVTEVTVNLDSLDTKRPKYKQITIDSRLDDRIDSHLDSILMPYRNGLTGVMNKKIGRSAVALSNEGVPLLNFLCDFALARGKALTGGNVDLALMNKGGIRRSLPKGDITEGQVIMMQPFNNTLWVIEISGRDLAEAFDVMASRGGDGVSAGVDVVFDASAKRCVSTTINGKPLDPDRTYRVATIDYLANGGDYMESLTRGTVVAKSDKVVYEDLLDYIKTAYKGKKISPSPELRMRPAK